MNTTPRSDARQPFTASHINLLFLFALSFSFNLPLDFTFALAIHFVSVLLTCSSILPTLPRTPLHLLPLDLLPSIVQPCQLLRH